MPDLESCRSEKGILEASKIESNIRSLTRMPWSGRALTDAKIQQFPGAWFSYGGLTTHLSFLRDYHWMRMSRERLGSRLLVSIQKDASRTHGIWSRYVKEMNLYSVLQVFYIYITVSCERELAKYSDGPTLSKRPTRLCWHGEPPIHWFRDSVTVWE